MMKKVLLVALLCLVATPAFAFSLNGYTGDITIKFGDYTVGRQYTQELDVNNNWTGVWLAEGARAGLTGGAQNMTNGVIDADGDGVEDSWGIIQVTSIHAGTSTFDPILWSSGDDGEYIKGFVYGYDDALIETLAGGDLRVLQVGGNMDLYLGNLSATGVPNPTAANRLSDPYNAIEGVLFASLVGIGGIDPLNPTITRSESVNGLTSPFTGQGSGYLQVVGGNYAYVLDGGTNRVFTQFDFSSDAPGTPFPTQLGWDAFSNDPAHAVAGVVPEPASMTLLGLGLAGLARLRRKN